MKRLTNYIIIFILLLILIITSIYIYSINISKNSNLEYDVDAELMLSQDVNYESIFNDYESKYKDKLNYIEYNVLGLNALVEPSDVIMTDKGVQLEYENGKNAIAITIIGLDKNSYTNYINALNANYEDIIIYNFETESENNEYNGLNYQVFQTDKPFKLSFVSFDNQTFNNYNDLANYINTASDDTLYSIDTTSNISVTKSEIYDNESLNSTYILTDTLPEGFNEIKTQNNCTPTIFVNMDKFNEIKSKKDERKEDKQDVYPWRSADDVTFIKIKCDKINKFSKYIQEIQAEKGIDILLTNYSSKK